MFRELKSVASCILGICVSVCVLCVCVCLRVRSLTDLLLPVAGDPAADLVSAVVAGDLPQAVPAVVLVGDALAVARLGRRALGGRPSFVMFATCGREGGTEG